MIVKSNYIQLFRQLIQLGDGFLGIEQGNGAADDANVEHIVLHLVIFRPEHEGKQRDIRAADVHKPAIPQHSGLIHRIGRYVDLQKVQQ